MPLDDLLADLLARTHNGLAVVFLDPDGETVEMAAAVDSHYSLRVLGAELGIWLRNLTASLDGAGLGAARRLLLDGTSLHVTVQPLAEGYFLALVQRQPALPAGNEQRLRRAAARLDYEIRPPVPERSPA